MSTLPPLVSTSTHSTEDAYTQLITALHPLQPSVLEIDILPSTYPPRILSEPPALALPKSLLTKLYLRARHTFFSPHVHQLHHDDPSYSARLAATSIILLFDPNHVTAANFRKRHLLHLYANNASPSQQQQAAKPAEPPSFAQALTNELSYLETLLTSPLHKHAKSSTLWSQRLWIHQHFLDAVIGMSTPTSTDNAPRSSRKLWSREMAIMMKAGERHPCNYYAWNYARRIFCIMRPFGLRGADCPTFLIHTMREVHRWCLMHPRDISGWTFLVFWIGKVRDHCRSSEGIMEAEVGKVVTETTEWMEKYDWKGESVVWFLNTLKELGLED